MATLPVTLSDLDDQLDVISPYVCGWRRRRRSVLPVGDVQRVLCVAAGSRDLDDVSTLRPDAVRPVHA